VKARFFWLTVTVAAANTAAASTEAMQNANRKTPNRVWTEARKGLLTSF
jgi:hypothetical protein